jgi:molybdenum cofactor cytidylyltransferase
MTENRQPKVGALLLAAGGSRRMGHAKQLLVWEGKTLLRRAAEMISGSVCYPIVIVLGAEHELAKAELEGLRTLTCINRDWETGMSSSIRHGLRELLENDPSLDAVIITLCDQPQITAHDIDHLSAEYRRTGAPIIAARYAGVTGVPALFSRQMFDDLFKLAGDKGAREVIRNGSVEIVAVDIEHAAYDIDTPDDADTCGETKR